MCLITFAYNAHPNYCLVLAANRDEFYDRPTAPLAFWTDHSHVLAGRDLQQQGTWMGVTTGGRIAAITNFRDPHHVKTGAPSRGHLVSDFLTGDTPPARYLESVHTMAAAYNGFNLIVGDPGGVFYLSNHAPAVQRIASGIHGLSNHLLDTPWPKVQESKQRLSAVLESYAEISEESLFEVLCSRTTAPDHQLPDTGVGLAWERLLSPVFISSSGYGTRSSSVLTIDRQGRLRFTEITWQTANPHPSEAFRRRFTLELPMTWN